MAGTNAGILIQKYNVFDDEDLNILGLDSRIKTDKLYLALSRTSNFQPPKNLLDLFFGEIFERIYTSNSSRVKKDDFIRNLTKVESGMGKKYGNHILLKALKDSAKVGDNMAKMVLGDIYQSGVIVPRDYNKSYDYYYSIFAQAIRVQNVQIESHAMFSIAYFYHYGLGVDKNLTKAINIYNDTLLYKGSNYYLTLFYMKMAQIEKQYYESYRNETTNPIKEKDITLMEMISFSINEFERKYTGKIAVGILGVAAVFLFLVRLRLKNYVDLYLKEHPEHN
jgi:FOG: TPR repeat, SEL1 subfamily